MTIAKGALEVKGVFFDFMEYSYTSKKTGKDSIARELVGIVGAKMVRFGFGNFSPAFSFDKSLQAGEKVTYELDITADKFSRDAPRLVLLAVRRAA